MNFKKNENDRYIYIVFIVTDTGIGKLIRLFTRNEYSHVALSFDHDLRRMFSFARYHINSPIAGGFVVEEPERYLIENRDVNIKICRLPISNKNYERIQSEIAFFQCNKNIMIYNTLNAVLSLNKKRVCAKNSYTCLEFVTYLLRMKNIMSVKELEKRLDHYQIYQGSLKKVAYIEGKYDGEFFQRRSAMLIVTDTAFHFKKVIGRFLIQ